MDSNNTVKVKRTDSSDVGFQKLIDLLDQELGENYSEEFDFYNQYNQVDEIKHVIVIYDNEEAVACGAIKQFDANTMEVKRMFTLLSSRGNGLASVVLKELENWSSELLYKNCILETGIKQHAAIGLHKKRGYALIPNYGQYVGVTNSICFLKEL